MVIQPIIWRRSVRQYSSEPVLAEAIEALIKAAQFAPTALNRREIEFIIIQNKLLKINCKKFYSKIILKPRRF